MIGNMQKMTGRGRSSHQEVWVEHPWHKAAANQDGPIARWLSHPRFFHMYPSPFDRLKFL